jgi:hypothetical protein
MDTLNSKTELAGGSAPHSLQPSHAEPVTQKPGQTATHAVLFTPELLCNIISQLPLADIVISTGVCHFWRIAVAADHHIQRALFFSPGEVRAAVIIKPKNIEILNIPSHWEPGRIIPSQMCCVLGDLNPFFRKICGVSPMTQLTRKTKDQDSSTRMSNFEFPHGNWRRMFISQPPCKKISMGVISFKGINTITHDNADGIRLGGLYDKMVKTLSSDEGFVSMRSPGTSSQQSNDPVFHITTIIESICERGSGYWTDIMEVPVQGGFARWPKNPVWIPKAEE